MLLLDDIAYKQAQDQQHLVLPHRLRFLTFFSILSLGSFFLLSVLVCVCYYSYVCVDPLENVILILVFTYMLAYACYVLLVTIDIVLHFELGSDQTKSNTVIDINLVHISNDSNRPFSVS